MAQFEGAGSGSSDPQSLAGLLTELDRDIWIPLRAAYEARDAAACLALYSPDMIRVEADANWLGSRQEYAERLRAVFADQPGDGFAVSLHLEFDERLVSSALASERGAFQVVACRDGADEVIACGRFHTSARKRNGRWQIAFDYDSSEDGARMGAVPLG